MSLRATTEGRVLVTAVDCGSPADEAGVAPGDEVLRVNGFDISGYGAIPCSVLPMSHHV
jgi:predicted metalloprotease with PDZ domain